MSFQHFTPPPSAELLSLDDPERHEEPETFPTAGQTFDAIIEVEHIGTYWEDTPDITFLHLPEGMSGPLEESSLRDLCKDDYTTKSNAGYRDGYCLPIASGVYRVRLEFWFHDCTGFEDLHPEYDYGFYVKALEKLQ